MVFHNKSGSYRVLSRSPFTMNRAPPFLVTLDQDWTFRVQRFQALAPDRKFFPAAGGEKFPPNGWLGGDCTGFFFPKKDPLRNSGFRNYFPNLAQILWKGGEGSRWWKHAICFFCLSVSIGMLGMLVSCFGCWGCYKCFCPYKQDPCWDDWKKYIYETMKDRYIYIYI